MPDNQGSLLESMSWYEDLLALITLYKYKPEDIIAQIKPEVLQALNHRSLFESIRKELDCKASGNINVASIVAQAILLELSPFVDDELLDEYEEIFKETKANIGGMVFSVRFEKIKRLAKEAFFEKYKIGIYES